MWHKNIDLTTRVAWLLLLLPAALVTWLSLLTLLRVEPAAEVSPALSPLAVDTAEPRSAAPVDAPGVSPNAFLSPPSQPGLQPQVVTPSIEWLPVIDELPAAMMNRGLGAADSFPPFAVPVQPVIQTSPLPAPAAP